MRKIITPGPSTADPFAGAPYSLVKMPRIGDRPATQYGPGVVTAVGRYGRTIVLDTKRHGKVVATRAPHASWTVRAPRIPTLEALDARRRRRLVWAAEIDLGKAMRGELEVAR